MAKKINSLRDLLIIEIKDIYDAEKRLTRAIPKFVRNANSSTLKTVLEGHLIETENQVIRLEKIFDLLDVTVSSKTCEAMKGLVKEGEEATQVNASDSVRDAMIIAAIQRMEHYEIAAYGTCKTIAEQLGLSKISNLIDQTLAEEKRADEKLTSVAETQLYEEEEENPVLRKKSA